MTESLDIRTMLQMGSLTCIILALIMLYYSLARKTYPGFHQWTAGMLCVSIGSIMVSMRKLLPDYVSIVIANFLISLMPFMFANGLAGFFNVKWRMKPYAVTVLALFVFSLTWFTYLQPNVFARVICVSIVFTLLFGESLRLILLYSKTVFETPEWLLTGFLGFAVTVSIFRLGVTVLAADSFGFLQNSGSLHEIALLMTIISVVGIACSFIIFNSHRLEEELLQANRKIERIANIDGLTNLFNRRYFETNLKCEFSRAQRECQPISLIIADIDCFKAYNDTYGHLCGDDCLREIACALKNCGARSSDIAARYGGEEFVLLLPNTDSNGARHLAESIMEKVAAKNIPHQASIVKDSVTISIGIATICPDSSTQPDELVRSADKALYTSKDKGRNQIQEHTA